MRDKSIYLIIAFVVLGTVALATGFEKVPYEPVEGTTRMITKTTRTVEPGTAERVSVELEQAIGELELEGGAGAGLMDASFDTRPASWLPDVDYSVEGTRGVLTVRQPDDSSAPFDHPRNTWDISLDESMPLDLTVKTGVGESRLDLSELNVTSLRALTGVGESRIDLTGERSADLSVDLESGLGEVRVIVPTDVPVRIRVEKGLGDFRAQGFSRDGDEWVNSAYGQDGPAIEMRVQQGIGEITIESR